MGGYREGGARLFWGEGGLNTERQEAMGRSCIKENSTKTTGKFVSVMVVQKII